MSKSDMAKINYAQRRDLRLRRDKTAAMILAAIIGTRKVAEGREVEVSVAIGDKLIAELDRTRQDLAPNAEKGGQSLE